MAFHSVRDTGSNKTGNIRPAAAARRRRVEVEYRFCLSIVPESRQPIPSPNSWWYLPPRHPVSGPPGVRNGSRSADSRRPWRTSRTFETVFGCHTLHTPESNRATRPSFCVECLFQSTRKIAPLTHANVLKTTPSCERAKFVS